MRALGARPRLSSRACPGGGPRLGAQPRGRSGGVGPPRSGDRWGTAPSGGGRRKEMPWSEQTLGAPLGSQPGRAVCGRGRRGQGLLPGPADVPVQTAWGPQGAACAPRAPCSAEAESAATAAATPRRARGTGSRGAGPCACAAFARPLSVCLSRGQASARPRSASPCAGRAVTSGPSLCGPGTEETWGFRLPGSP